MNFLKEIMKVFEFPQPEQNYIIFQRIFLL